jgi:general secretion pathway protein H
MVLMASPVVKVIVQTYITGSNSGTHQRGFTLLELLVVFAMIALILGASIPATARLYDSSVYRSAVGDTQSALIAARYRAVAEGKNQDVVIDVEELTLVSGRERIQYPGGVSLDVLSAREVNVLYPGKAVVRFYPDGTSTGGTVGIRHERGMGVDLKIDWLLGRVTQEPHAL